MDVVYLPMPWIPASGAKWSWHADSRVSRAGASNHTPRYLWNVITCSCIWYLLLAHYYIHIRYHLCKYILTFIWIHSSKNRLFQHDDVIKWKHHPRNWPFVRGIHRSPVNSPHKGQWREALMFSLICVWISGWVNNREAGDLRRYGADYDTTVINLDELQHGNPQNVIPWDIFLSSSRGKLTK